jgi:hypothetical protein
MRKAFTAAAAAVLVGSLSACGGGGSGGVLSDSKAIEASGAKSCVKDPDTMMVRSEFACDGVTLTTFGSVQQREAMAQVAAAAGFQTVVKQDANWLLTKDV